ncbi:MAG: hypothetical protein IKJ15_03640 [Lachnospiraceae bacterium]|nr:hypothetical protein [Lachnospiraceae bacterium]
MGKIDTCTKEYISNPRIFADAFNYYFFHGKQVVKPDDRRYKIPQKSLCHTATARKAFLFPHKNFGIF